LAAVGGRGVRSDPTPWARKRFGQHFLEPSWVDPVLEAIAPGGDDVFLEIGPGRGALTIPLASRCRQILAVEVDRHLAAALKRQRIPRLVVVAEDFLRTPLDRLRDQLSSLSGSGRVRVVGNLPYNIASPILFRLLDLSKLGLAMEDASLMVQREVAARLTASPGTREYGALTVSIGLATTVQRLMSLPPAAFRPVPKVHSALVRLQFDAHTAQPLEMPVFVGLVRTIFTRRRKMLVNALKAFPLAVGAGPARVLSEAGLDARRRPETLSLPELIRLADTLSEGARTVASDRAVL
jgi:16S rRNA (adenine1518-N6/adenine1519-N6)-dimethyltransferase